MRAEDRLIVALDTDSLETAEESVRELAGMVKTFKVGLELFISFGRDSVEILSRAGAGVFLDLKLHDIPNTVAGAARAACAMGIQMFTVHASGGARMIKAAYGASSAVSPSPLLLAVTVLTHLDAAALKDELGIPRRPAEQAVLLAGQAIASGAGGIVCSPEEISPMRKAFGEKIVIAAPGIRPEGDDRHDQKRVFTPERAVSEGADYIIVGRPVMCAPERRKAAENILRSIDGL